MKVKVSNHVAAQTILLHVMQDMKREGKLRKRHQVREKVWTGKDQYNKGREGEEKKGSICWIRKQLAKRMKSKKNYNITKLNISITAKGDWKGGKYKNKM